MQEQFDALSEGDLFGLISVAELVDFLFSLLGALVVLVLAFFFAKWARGALYRALERSRLDVTLARFFSNVAYYLLLLVGVLACLTTFGVDVTSVAAILAAAGFAVGLALQGTLSNFSAGIMLLVFRPFKVGDVVSVAGITAKVVEIELFTTLFDTPDNRRIIVPNGKIFGEKIENISHHPMRRADVNVGTDYGADLRETRRVLEGVVASVEGGLAEPAPQVYLLELGDSSINWVLRVWANASDFWAVKERVTQQTKEALDAAGISIPFPQMDVHLDGPGDGAAPPAEGPGVGA